MSWYSKNALDAELDYIRQNAESIRLVNSFDPAIDTYASVVSNSVAAAAIGPSDFGDSADNGYSRRMSFNGKDGTATANDTNGNLYMVILDVNGTDILAVTDETSDGDVVNGADVEFPTFYMQADQPTQV